MFGGLQPASIRPLHSAVRRGSSVGVSVAAHLALLAGIVFHSVRAIDLSPSELPYGNSSYSYRLMYVVPSDQNDNTPAEAARLLFPHKSKPRPHLQSAPSKPIPEQQAVTADAETGDHNSHAGSPLGTMVDGPITGHEVHVAYPVVYPDPPVARAELPKGLVGDVVIEVTIDSEGNVIETKIVQAIGHGIDEKIEATLRRWHYQPATLDGTPVASRHDVHFHFPS